jgi:hypothetical protein
MGCMRAELGEFIQQSWAGRPAIVPTCPGPSMIPPDARCRIASRSSRRNWVVVAWQLAARGKDWIIAHPIASFLPRGLRLDKFERYPLTFGPTPIEYLPRMTEALGGRVQIYAKRDDCNSGLAMGGV